MNRKLLFAFIVSTTILGGCAFFSKLPQLLTLKRVSSSQKQMERCVEKKKKYLKKLKKDIDENKLEKGITYRRFIKLYGEPVLEKDSGKKNIKKVLLYRHPTEYFNTDKVYIYFDLSDKLVSWEYQKQEE
ncbi:MAG: hypothetical protein K9L77_02710 [Candidatus Omnitrophica bacterium]|nr:hypothetical protein [Candidatus Omnitrophota bacterium]MCF7876979.1 hypothetical protein [Candidatus Omnitrophota bacterium]MCF7893058.1 hypothetical protein [Candidatus Omnitrophota bacterium]